LFIADPIKRWILKRTHELGYNPVLHADFDSQSSHHDRHENRIERIGKKYQWIAFHEAIARIADNHKFREERWNTSSPYTFYPGPWISYIRDIDPVFITRNRNTDESPNSETINQSEDNWWIDRSYNYWYMESVKWANMVDDLPDVKKLIQPIDKEGNEWLTLKSSIHWKESRPLGKVQYAEKQKEIWYTIQAYLVRKRDKSKILNFLKTKSFFNRWMPESFNSNRSIFIRENYWSPAANSDEKQSWQTLDEVNLKVMVTTAEAVSEMSSDKSGAHYRFYMPCRLIFEKLNLRYSDIDGEFLDVTGNVVVKSPSQSENTLLINKSTLLKFLKENNLDLIWTLLGEKNIFSDSFNDQGKNIFKVINGVYSLDREFITGNCRLDDRH
jgi:hypothetical protein